MYTFRGGRNSRARADPRSSFMQNGVRAQLPSRERNNANNVVKTGELL